MSRSLSLIKWANGGGNSVRTLVFAIPFLIMVSAKADLISGGKMRQMCGAPVQSKVVLTTKLTAPSKNTIYLNLAQTIKSHGIGNVHECRPLVYMSPVTTAVAPKTTAAVTLPVVYSH